MSRRTPSIADLNIRSEQPIKRFKTSPTGSSYRNIFEQFNDVLPLPSTSVTNTATQSLISKTSLFKLSSQQSSSSTTSSSVARSIMAKKKLTKDNNELWSNLFQPKKRQDLILHPKKIKELEEILQRSCQITKTNKVKREQSLFLNNNHNIYSNQRPSKLILISGPSGSGKSTCLRILAASLNINIIEWETRTTSNLTSTVLDDQRGRFFFLFFFLMLIEIILSKMIVNGSNLKNVHFVHFSFKQLDIYHRLQVMV